MVPGTWPQKIVWLTGGVYQRSRADYRATCERLLTGLASCWVSSLSGNSAGLGSSDLGPA
jgi:hypothetical protein